MNECVYYYKIKDNRTISISRVFGNDPVVEIPSMIDGMIVNEIEAYCFSKQKDLSGCLCTKGDVSYLTQLVLETVEEVILPDTIERIGSYAFYNCRKCRKITFSKQLKQIGSDVFLNCLSLHTIYMRCNHDEISALKLILKQITWDVDVHFVDGVFSFPEYYENYDVIGPAHIFGMNMSGEGYRARQCFVNNQFQIQEYDLIFERLCLEESAKTLCHFAWNRILYPVVLNEDRRGVYSSYIKEHIQLLATSVLQNSTYSNEDKMIQFKTMLENELLNKECMDVLITQATKLEYYEMVTYLIQWKKQYFQKKNTYEFEDFE